MKRCSDSDKQKQDPANNQSLLFWFPCYTDSHVFSTAFSYLKKIFKRHVRQSDGMVDIKTWKCWKKLQLPGRKTVYLDITWGGKENNDNPISTEMCVCAVVYSCVLMCVGVYTGCRECVLLRHILISRADRVTAGQGEAGVTRTRQRWALCGQQDRRAQPASIHQRRSLLSKLAPRLMYERAAGWLTSRHTLILTHTHTHTHTHTLKYIQYTCGKKQIHHVTLHT